MPALTLGMGALPFASVPIRLPCIEMPFGPSCKRMPVLKPEMTFPCAGVRPPNSSWGTMIADGYQMIYTAPHLTIVPGLMIIATVLSLNVFGDGLREALDPRAKIRLEH